MLIYDEKQKQIIYNWRKKNPEKYNEYMKEKNREYYQRNKEKILLQKKEKRKNQSSLSDLPSVSINLNPV
jgi:hypothetical protein